MATFGERIKELRKQRGLTQKQMAAEFNVTERNYQRYEATDSPSNETLLKLAKFFEVSTDDLVGNNAPQKIVFKEPLESYAVWLRKMGISISGGSETAMIVTELENNEFYDISDNADLIMQMTKDHYKLIVRQLGKKWPSVDGNLD